MKANRYLIKAERPCQYFVVDKEKNQEILDKVVVEEMVQKMSRDIFEKYHDILNKEILSSGPFVEYKIDVVVLPTSEFIIMEDKIKVYEALYGKLDKSSA